MRPLLFCIALCFLVARPASSSAQWLGGPGPSATDAPILRASAAFSAGDHRGAHRVLRVARRASDDERLLVASVALSGGDDPGLVLTLSDETLAALASERAAIDGQQALAVGLGIGGAALGVGAGAFAVMGLLDDGCSLLATACVSDPNEAWFVGAAVSGVVGLSLALASIALLADDSSRAGRWQRAYRSGIAPGDLHIEVTAGLEGGAIAVRGVLP